MARIVVIEDNPMNMKLVHSILIKHGHDILEARDAEQGLCLIRESRPDIILMDVQLPGMDGLEAIRIIKSDSTLAKVPVIALTALAMSGDKDRGIAAGFDGYITKPIRYQMLLEEISKHLEEI